MELTTEDIVVLEQLARERTTSEPQFEEVKNKLIYGFTKYAEDGILPFIPTRHELFKQRSDWILENFHVLGKTSRELFCSEEGTRNITTLLKRMGVPQKDLDDEVQKAQIKFWKHQLAEKYNPILAPFGYHLSHSLKTCFASYLAARQRNPVATGFSYQRYIVPSESESGDLELEPYELEQDLLPENKMIVGEALASFEAFLANERQFRTKLFRGHKTMCTILPPGVKGLVLEEKLDAYIVVKGQKTFRVSPVSSEEGENLLVPVALITDIRDNPNFDPNKKAVRIDRSPVDVYKLMVKGYQVDEIAKELKVGESTAHNWARNIIELYELWWLETDWIPEHLKDLALETRECPGCKKRTEDLPAPTTERASKFEAPNKEFHWCKNTEGSPREGHWCPHCQKWDLKGVKAEVRLTAYPWNELKGTRDIQTRAAKYKPGMSVQKCSL